MAKKADRLVIYLECTECKAHRYTTQKNKRNDPARLELRKFCPDSRCRSHKTYRESR
jgi:large subunit ribosomal protein L33